MIPCVCKCSHVCGYMCGDGCVWARMLKVKPNFWYHFSGAVYFFLREKQTDIHKERGREKEDRERKGRGKEKGINHAVLTGLELLK